MPPKMRFILIANKDVHDMLSWTTAMRLQHTLTLDGCDEPAHAARVILFRGRRDATTMFRGANGFQFHADGWLPFERVSESSIAIWYRGFAIRKPIGFSRIGAMPQSNDRPDATLIPARLAQSQKINCAREYAEVNNTSDGESARKRELSLPGFAMAPAFLCIWS